MVADLAVVRDLAVALMAAEIRSEQDSEIAVVATAAVFEIAVEIVAVDAAAGVQEVDASTDETAGEEHAVVDEAIDAADGTLDETLGAAFGGQDIRMERERRERNCRLGKQAADRCSVDKSGSTRMAYLSAGYFGRKC